MKVTRQNEGPSASAHQMPADVVKAAAQTATETDAQGRVIEVGRLNALQYYRLTKAMGASAAANSAAMELASLACAVRAINGEQIEFPATESQVEFLIQRLDFDGIQAAGLALAKLSSDGADERQAAKN